MATEPPTTSDNLLYGGDDEPTICLTHMRFPPCRNKPGCHYSTDPDDVDRVRAYQQGE